MPLQQRQWTTTPICSSIRNGSKQLCVVSQLGGQRNVQSRGMVGVEKGFSLKSESCSMAANSRFTCRLYFLSLFEDAKRGSADGIGLGDSCLPSQRHSCCMSCSHRSLLVGTSFVVITVFSQGPGPSASRTKAFSCTP